MGDAMDKPISNITAERLAVGILLVHPEWVIEVASTLRADYFTLLGHKTIYFLLLQLVQEGRETIDNLTILAKAEKYKQAPEIIQENGGLEYLETLKQLAINYSVGELRQYALEVIACSYKREQTAMVKQYGRLLETRPDWTIADADMWLTEHVRELQAKYTVGQQVQLIGDVFDSVWEEIEWGRQEGRVGLPTKIPLLNNYFTYRNGELTVIGGRPKYGKSMWGINEAHYLAVRRGIPVAYFDTEMKTRTFLARIVSLDSGVPIRAIETGSYEADPTLKMRVEASKERVKASPLMHKYYPYWDRGRIENEAKLAKLRHNIGLLIYDYIKVKEVGAKVQEHAELGNWTIFLKDLAGDLDVPILTFGQMSPHETRLADSDKINRYASTIAYLMPKSDDQIRRDIDAEQGGKDYIYVDYNRNGPTMDGPDVGINLIYKRDYASFEQAPHQPLDDEMSDL